MAVEETEVTNDEVEFDEDVFASMLDGTFGEASDDEADTAEDDEHQEDTDQEDESGLDEETNDEDDGSDQDTSEDAEEDEEEDTLVEDYDSDDEDDVTEDEEDEADEAEESDDEDSGEESEDDAETEDPSDGEDSGTDKVDYKAFYEAVTNAEFVVNGKKVKGFSDPQKIIQSQQMAGGFSEKMAGFKQYRPYMAPLKERGMLEDQSKFDLAMNLVDGDKEAIKLHLKTLGIDPLELDMDTIDYKPTPSVASQESLVVEDVLERAKGAGVEDRVRQVIGKEWDAESFQEFVTNPAVRDDLLNHIETGAYDKVQDKIVEMKRLDYNGSFSSKKTIDQYRDAVKALQAEYVPPVESNASVEPKPAKAAPKASSVKAEKAKIEQARKEAEYKAKAEKEEAKRMSQRKRAASSSKSKGSAKAKPKFDPMAVEGEELDQLMEFLISGGRE